MNIIRIPGLADYQETLRLQEQLVRAHQEDPDRENELLLLEHAGVYKRDESGQKAFDKFIESLNG